MVVESGYKFQAKATTEFGIEFRSKLEAQWAYYFQSRGLDWQYADHAWYDFTVNEIKIEVKPYAEGMLHRAAERIPNGDIVVVVFGSAPLNFNSRFSSHIGKDSINAVSVWMSDSGSTIPLFRDARVGLYYDDVFFREGLKKEDADGRLMLDRLCCEMATNGEIKTAYKKHYSTFLFNNASPAICGVLSGLISCEDRERIKESIILYSNRMIEMLNK